MSITDYRTSIDVSVLTAYHPYIMKVSKFHPLDNIVTLKRFPNVSLSTAFWRLPRHVVRQNCCKFTKNRAKCQKNAHFFEWTT